MAVLFSKTNVLIIKMNKGLDRLITPEKHLFEEIGLYD